MKQFASFVDNLPMKMKLMLLTVLFLLLAVVANAKVGPTLLMDKQPQSMTYTSGIGPTIKYKRVSAPNNFGGDMTVWGIRAFAGRLRDPALGLMYQAGTLNGRSMKFNLEMGGLTLEDNFREDARVKWRVSLGIGQYKLESSASGLSLNEGTFSFFEPMLFGVLPLSRHIVLEIGCGYTFAAGTGVRLEGLALQTELLMGKF